MSTNINGTNIDTSAVEYGVKFDDDYTVVFDDELEARCTRQMTGGKIVSRTVYFMAWSEVEN